MTGEEKEIFRKKILDLIAETKDNIAELKILTQPVEPDEAIGRISRMDAINNKSVNDAALFKAENKLTKLQYALTKVDDPEFGKCTSCDNQIQEGRLLLLPESNKCVRCAARQ